MYVCDKEGKANRTWSGSNPTQGSFFFEKRETVLGVYLSSITDAQLMAGYQGMCMYTIWMKDAQTTS